MKIHTLLTPLALAISAVPASSALLVYEGFDYTASSALSGQNGGTGFASGEAWNVGTTAGSNTGALTVGSASLSYGTLETTGGSAVGSASGSVQMFRDFGSATGGASTNIWMSFLIDASTVTTGFSLYGGNTEQTFFGGISGGINGRLYGGSNRPLTTSTDGTAVPFATGGPFMIVAQFDATGATPVYNVWINPDISSLGTGAAPTGGTLSTYTTGTQSFSSDRIRIGMFSGATDMTLDELRIGESWTDVSPTAIPEPSSALLSSLGLAGLLLRRKPRSL